MTTKTLIIYATTDGQTRKISEAIRDVLVTMDHEVRLYDVRKGNIDITPFEKIVVGSSIRYGKHQPPIVEFIKKNSDILSTKKNTFFSVNLVARKPEKSTPETNPYVRKFLMKISWKPQKVAVFAGKLDYGLYPWLDAFLIRLIMYITSGPPKSATPIEYTDWIKVREFAEVIAKM